METTKVIIENWPNTPWYKDWVPIIIAVIALVVSIISMRWTIIEHRNNLRPFVWAINYAVIDNENKTYIQVPFRAAYRVKNSPAKILQTEVKILYDSQVLLTNTEKNFVRFPDENSEWSFAIGKEEFEKIMKRPPNELSKLQRLISIEYSALDGLKIYHFKLTQVFVPADNQWKDINVEAD